MNPLKKLAGQTIIYGIPTIIGRFINWLLVPLYTIVFLKSEYGVVVNLMAYTAFFMVLLTYGMETGYFRFASREDKSKVFSNIMASLFSTTLIFLFAIFLFIDNIQSFLDIGVSKDYIILLALTISLDAICSIPFAKLRLDCRPLRFAFIKTVNISTNVLLNLLLLLFFPWVESNFNIDIPFYDFSYGIGYIFLAYFLSSFITLLFLIPEFRSMKWAFDKPLFLKIIKYSFPIFIVGIAGVININLDKMILPKLLKSGDVAALTGIYGANYKLALIMYIFVQAFKFAFEPFFFSKYKSDDSKEIYAKVFNYFSFFGLLIFLCVMFYIDKLKFFIPNTSYHEGLVILPWVLMANLFQGLYYSMSLWYKLSDKTIYGAYIAIAGSLITIVSNIILIPRLGYMGCAYSVFICFLFMCIASYFLGQKYYKVDYNLKKLFLYFSTAFILYFLSKYIVVDNVWLRMFLKTPLILIFCLVFICNEKLYFFKKDVS